MYRVLVDMGRASAAAFASSPCECVQNMTVRTVLEWQTLRGFYSGGANNVVLVVWVWVYHLLERL